jgi:hypothetical protein
VTEGYLFTFGNTSSGNRGFAILDPLYAFPELATGAIALSVYHSNKQMINKK